MSEPTKTETPISLQSRHERSGHSVTVDAHAGVLFCSTCGHHILSVAQENAAALVEFLDDVIMGNSEFETLEKIAVGIMQTIDPQRYFEIQPED